jgi:hypothetical protein
LNHVVVRGVMAGFHGGFSCSTAAFLVPVFPFAVFLFCVGGGDAIMSFKTAETCDRLEQTLLVF